MRRRVACVLAALLGSGCAARASVGEAQTCMLGAGVALDAQPDASTPEGAFASYEALVGRHMAVDRIYHDWNDAVPSAREPETLAHGRIPFSSWNGRRAGLPEVSWAEVASGSQDAFIGQVADGYRALGVRVFCAYYTGPDADEGTTGTAAEYRAAARHVVAVFRAHGATNVAWVFVLNYASYPSRADDFYPGDDVTDWIGTTAYNNGTTLPGGRWLSLRAMLADFVAWATPHARPLMLSEWATVEDATAPDRKAAWFSDALAALRDTPGVRAALYAQHNHADSLPYNVDTSAGSLGAFRQIAADPYLDTITGR